jgi:hypothetical protein
MNPDSNHEANYLPNSQFILDLESESGSGMGIRNPDTNRPAGSVSGSRHKLIFIYIILQAGVSRADTKHHLVKRLAEAKREFKKWEKVAKKHMMDMNCLDRHF